MNAIKKALASNIGPSRQPNPCDQNVIYFISIYYSALSNAGHLLRSDISPTVTNTARYG